MRWPRLVLALAARTVMGLLSASVLSVIGIGVAWALFVFFGAAAHATLLTLFAAGAGIGAGVGGYIAWLRFDHVPSWQGHLGTVLALALAGAGGAWGGFQFGASQEIACCTGPAITPITYTALGATAAANVLALAVGVVHEINLGRKWVAFRAVAGSPAFGASRDERHTPH
jgi:hypothetical protein